EVRQSRQVVTERRRLRGEPVTGELHPVTGVAREPDHHPVPSADSVCPSGFALRSGLRVSVAVRRHHVTHSLSCAGMRSAPARTLPPRRPPPAARLGGSAWAKRSRPRPWRSHAPGVTRRFVPILGERQHSNARYSVISLITASIRPAVAREESRHSL